MSDTHRRASARSAKRRAGFAGLVVALMLIVGQSGLMVASAGTSDRSRDGDSTSDTTVVTTDGGADSNGGSSSIAMRESRNSVGASSARAVAGGDVSIDFVAAGPFTYNHTSPSVAGPGLPEFGSRTISKTAGVVESLEGGDFSCNDKVLFFVELTVDNSAAIDAASSLDIGFSFENDLGVGFRVFDNQLISAQDSGMSSDGNETVSLLTTNGPRGNTNSDALTATVRVTDLDRGEAIILALVAQLKCSPSGAPNGNLLSQVTGATIVGGSKVNVGAQTVPLKSAADILETKLVVIKHVVNDDGGSALASAWTMDVTATNPSSTGFAGAESPGVTITVDPGVYSVDESGGPSGYAKTLGADCSGTISAGQTKTCMITNDDIAPQLTVVKHVINDSGTGTSAAKDFTMSVTGTNVSPSSFAGAESPGTPVALDAGNYGVSESGPAGYAQTSSADCSGTIAVGQTKTCTITNDDIPRTPPPPPPPAAGGIQIDKTGPASAHVGDSITYSFAVSLVAGSPNVNNVSVSDPKCDTGTLTSPTKTGGDQDTTLEQGEVWTYSCKHVVTASDPDPLPNTGTASGVDVNGHAVSDTDSHEVDIIHPEITVVKRADPTQGSPGERIRYTYTVTNSGDVTLYDVSVHDDVLGHICDIAQLDPGETETCAASYVIPEDSGITITNVVVAGGTDPLGVDVRDEDEATIDVVLGATVTPTKTPPGGVAFTGAAAAIPLGGIALLFLTVGTALMWAGRRRGKHAAQ